MLPQLFPEAQPLPPAILALADGTIFRGVSIGAPGHTVAEVVFNTAMTGYQEILTDPSYSGQIVTLTYPHIGNTGVNAEDVEANRVYASGLVVRDRPARVSNFRSTQSLPEYLAEQGIVAISGIDTCKLTRILRERAPRAPASSSAPTPSARRAGARGFPAWPARTWPASCPSRTAPTGPRAPGELGGYTAPDQSRFHVVAYDFGVKSNILRLLADRGCRITLVPAQTTADEVLAQSRRRSLSNGPGDPEPATTPSKPPASSWTRSCPCSASAWATRSWAWRWAARPSR